MEVKVRLREPLSGQDMQTSTERWLVISHTQVTLKVIFLLRLTVLIQLLMLFFFLPRFLFRCCQRGSDNLKGTYLLSFKNSKSKIIYRTM